MQENVQEDQKQGKHERSQLPSSLEEEKRELIERLGAWSPQMDADLRQKFARASAAALNDVDVAMACAEARPDLLEYFSLAIRDNAEVMRLAATREGYAFRLASEGLRANRAFVLELVKSSGLALAHASEEIRADREVVLAAGQQDDRALFCAPLELRQEKGFMLAVINQQWQALCFASDELRADKEVVLAAVTLHGGALEYASEELRADKEVVLTALATNGGVLQHASASLQADKEVVLAAVRQDGRAVLYANEELKADRDVAFEALKRSPDVLDWVAPELRADKDFLVQVARVCEDSEDAEQVYEEADPVVQDDLEFERFLEVFQSSLAIQGDRAPIFAVKLASHESASCFCFEVSLPSGSCFTCEVPDVPGPERPGPVVNDLAVALLGELQQQDEVPETEGAKYVFITLERGEGDFRLLTAWECDQPLADFL